MDLPGSTIDFSGSFVTWKLLKANDFGRFSLDAVCILNSDTTSETFFLAAGVMAGDVYGSGYLLRQPAYHYQALFSESHYRIFRLYASQQQDLDSIGEIEERFESIKFSIKRSTFRPLENFDSIADAAMEMLSINAHIHIEIDDCTTAEMIFPVRHINIESDRRMFQAETGLVLAPIQSFSGTGIERMLPAFLAFNRLDEVSFAFLAANGIGKDVIRSYCGVQQTSARIQLVVPVNNQKEN